MTITHDQVRWPSGYLPFYRRVRDLRGKILSGTVLAIDPSSGGTSLPGYAVYQAGELLTSGEIQFPKRQDIYARLQRLYDEIRKLAEPDVLVLEEIRGANFSHQYLRWACGVSIAAGRAPDTLELPINCWKAVAKIMPGYMKGNAMDAECIGATLILLAQRFEEASDGATG